MGNDTGVDENALARTLLEDAEEYVNKADRYLAGPMSSKQPSAQAGNTIYNGTREALRVRFLFPLISTSAQESLSRLYALKQIQRAMERGKEGEASHDEACQLARSLEYQEAEITELEHKFREAMRPPNVTLVQQRIAELYYFA